MIRRLLMLAAVGLMVGLAGCSDDDGGKQLGEPCDAHGECASNLCTVPIGPSDGGVPQKVCTDPTID